MPNAEDADATVNTSAELNVTDDTVAEVGGIAVSKENGNGDTEKKDASLNAEIDQCIQDIIEINKSNVQPENSTNKRPASDADNANIPLSKKAKLDDGVAASSSSSGNDVCQKPTISLYKFTGASFWPLEWRTKLCKCSSCLDMYKKNEVEFLLDEEDTVHAYQEKGKAKAENRSTSSLHDETMRAISGLDHRAQIEAILAYNKLKKKLTEFLTTFVSNEQVVTAKDVDTFFRAEGKKD